MDVKEIVLYILIAGGLVHLLMGIGQLALIAPLSPVLGTIQIIVGVVAIYALAVKFKVIK